MQYVPSNVTRIGDLPAIQYLYLGFAPWFSAACTQSYLAAARAVEGLDGLIFYTPNNGTGTPPPISDEIWNLNDGGKWKSENKYPVYAIPGVDGAMIMQQLAQYSGNSSSPQAQNILVQEGMDPNDYVRLYTTLALNGGNNLPTLWAFLLIVLAIVLLIIGLTSLSMHYYQRQNRRALERRIRSGEVDLETLGIKRLRVPQATVNNLRTFVYISDGNKSTCSDDFVNPISHAPSQTNVSTSSAPDHNIFDQSQCVICLEDFISHKTTVRSLPCRHIYHPKCIDEFLLDNSSLCPLCKARVIPKEQNANIQEPVTNAMVRYERRARRIRLERETRQAQNEIPETQAGANTRHFPNLRRICGRNGRIFSAPGAVRTASQIEMAEVGSRAVSYPGPISNTETSVIEPRPPADSNLRREWMSRRMSTLLGRQPTLEELEAERQARMPACNSTLKSQITPVMKCMLISKFRAKSPWRCLSRVSIAPASGRALDKCPWRLFPFRFL